MIEIFYRRSRLRWRSPFGLGLNEKLFDGDEARIPAYRQAGLPLPLDGALISCAIHLGMRPATTNTFKTSFPVLVSS
jgi:hypothetical protein